MRTGIILVVALLLGGCGVELVTTTAIQSELQAEQMKAMKGQLEKTGSTAAKINIQKAIDTFQAEKGRYPASLDELVPGYLPSLPKRADGSDYGYDPVQGKFYDGPVPPAAQGPTANDMQKMNQILSAIDGYGRATGYYPPSLAALVPTYIAALPKTDAGQDFVYDVATGRLSHPAQTAAAPVPAAPPRPVAGGGAGPMGEVVTGIGIQNQLNSMGSSATNSAGGYARQNIGNTTGNYGANQEKVMDNLGL